MARSSAEMKPAYWYLSGFLTLFFFIYMSAIQYVRGYQLDYVYHNHDSMEALLKNISYTYPNFAQLYSVGKSVQGRDLWVLMVTKYPQQDSLLRPNVKYVANMHGNEAVGRELLVHLIMYLIDNYNHDQYARWMLDNTRIHFMPSMNPDGFEIATEGHCTGVQGRYNARGFDLNRNFPDYFKTNDKELQPETKATRNWLESHHFILSGNLHGGALVASYPFDNTPNSIFQSYSSASLTPDDDTFKHLALVYSTNHETMHLGIPCRDGGLGFPNGTTNGAAWYPLTGGMQDYNYIWTGCMEVTFELSCCKFPLKAELPRYWRANSKSLLKFLGEAHRGVKGIVVDHNNIPLGRVNLKIRGRDIGFTTTGKGEYWRILLPGSYTLEAKKDGYHATETDFLVSGPDVTILNFTMYPTRLVSPSVPLEGSTRTNSWEDHFNSRHPSSGQGSRVNFPSSTALAPPSTSVWSQPPRRPSGFTRRNRWGQRVPPTPAYRSPLYTNDYNNYYSNGQTSEQYVPDASAYGSRPNGYRAMASNTVQTAAVSLISLCTYYSC